MGKALFTLYAVFTPLFGQGAGEPILRVAEGIFSPPNVHITQTTATEPARARARGGTGATSSTARARGGTGMPAEATAHSVSKAQQSQCERGVHF